MRDNIEIGIIWESNKKDEDWKFKNILESLIFIENERFRHHHGDSPFGGYF